MEMFAFLDFGVYIRQEAKLNPEKGTWYRVLLLQSSANKSFQSPFAFRLDADPCNFRKSEQVPSLRIPLRKCRQRRCAWLYPTGSGVREGGLRWKAITSGTIKTTPRCDRYIIFSFT